MKKLCCAMIMVMLLSGCSSGESPVFETVGRPKSAPSGTPTAGIIDVILPQEAAVQTGADEETAEIYTWEDYEVRLETTTSGDIQSTLEKITGLNADELTVMKQSKDNLTLYQTVWSTTGEEEVLCGRALVADDGAYHYCMTLLSPEDINTDELYAQMTGSFRIRSGYTGK